MGLRTILARWEIKLLGPEREVVVVQFGYGREFYFIFFCLFVSFVLFFGPRPTKHRAYSLHCTQGSLLALLERRSQVPGSVSFKASALPAVLNIPTQSL